MAPRKRDRALERVPDGVFPVDRAAPLDPGALHKFLSRAAPLTAAQARALVVEANKRTRCAAAAREKQHREFMEAMARGDWLRAGALHAAEQRAALAPIVKTAGEAALAARDLATGRRLGRDVNAARRRVATRRAEGYVRQAQALRKKHGADWPVSRIIDHIRRIVKNPVGVRQIRRDLAAYGIM
jgi:hypothetical protein